MKFECEKYAKEIAVLEYGEKLNRLAEKITEYTDVDLVADLIAAKKLDKVDIGYCTCVRCIFKKKFYSKIHKIRASYYVVLELTTFMLRGTNEGEPMSIRERVAACKKYGSEVWYCSDNGFFS